MAVLSYLHHLFNAEQHGLDPATNLNTQGRINGDKAPGQGSPYSGGDTKTPATDTDAANLHANVKDRGGTPGHNAGGTPGHTTK